MKPICLGSAALIACLPLAAQTQRDPNHPLPPTASSLVTTAPQLPQGRDAVTPPTTVAPPAVDALQYHRRSGQRPSGKVAPVLSRVLFDQPVADGPLWAMGTDWKASFDGRGFEFIPFFGSTAPRNFPVRLELDQVTVGGQALPLADGVPQQVGFAVHTPRGGVTEVVAASLQAVEQSFVFDQLPNRGAIQVEVRIASELAVTSTAQGIRLANEHGAVRYEKAVAIDAAGTRLELPIVWDGGEVHMTIPASFVEQARLPLVLDPWIASIGTIGTGAPTGQLQRDADVATVQSIDRTCIVWRREWSATDHDAWAQVFDSSQTAVAPEFTIDFTSLDWLSPAVAGNNFSQNFLCVSDVRTGTLYYIAGRRIDGNLGVVLGNQFDIERNGVVGLAGNNFRPDVGGDFYPGTLAYWGVVFEKEVAAGNRDIYMKLVRQDGTLLTTNPIALDTSSTDESNPCISKQNGNVALWFVAWQRTWPNPPFDQEVIGKFVSWSGAVQAPNMYIAGTLANETAPATSSPITIEGVNYWMVCHETDFQVAAGQRDILCKVFDSAGAQLSSFNLNQNEAGGAYASYDQQAPAVDSDGVRFVATYTDRWAGTLDFETHASTLAFLPATNALRIDDDRVGLGASVGDEFGTRVCSHFSGGGVWSPYFAVTDAHFGNNTIELYRYGGYSPGTQFSFYSSQCGSLSITPSGNTAVGGTVNVTVPNGPLSGTIFGYPGYIPLNALGCNCICGVNNGLLFGNPLVWTIPSNPIFVGTTLSVQGWTAVGTNCLGFVDLSDTVDFTIR